MSYGLIQWNTEKNDWLKENRAVSFEDVVTAIDNQNVVGDRAHPKKPNQRMLILRVNDYLCAVPYVTNELGIFLKTIYPDRRLKKMFGVENE